MSADFQRRFDDSNVAQQRFISLFLRSEREIFRYVAALVPNVSDAEDIVQQTALVLWEKFDAYDPEAARQKLKLLYLSCGNRDGLIRISQGVHTYLKEKQVPHIWHVDGNGHDATHWRNSLYHFAQLLFR